MKSTSVILISLAFFKLGFSQQVPKDSLFLGQKLPGTTPQEFKLEVTPGTFAAERIAISNDGSEIFYSEIGGYYPNRGEKVRLYKYENNRWSGAKIIFDGYAAPAFSITNDSIFLEKEFSTYYSVRGKNGWSAPELFFTGKDTAHYTQVTRKGNYYTAAPAKNSVGKCDWSMIIRSDNKISYSSLGYPVNNMNDNLDFCMAPDESFMITCLLGPIGISYPQKDGRWTNTRFFNSAVNFGIGGWGAYLTSDNKYLFFSTGTKMDYSDVHVYWVRIDNQTDSLKNTNLPPYIKNKPSTQTAIKNEKFTFVIPSDAFCDEDGSRIVTYEMLSLNGSPLPVWLTFDPATRTLTGIPTEPGQVLLRINAYDDKKDMAACRFVINVQ